VRDDADDSADDVGSLGEEAAKLLGALSGWALEHGSDLGEGLGGLAGQVAGGAREVNDHLATGAEECRYCPVCRVVHLVRDTSPEVRAHLAVAGAALLQAAAGLLATAGHDEPAAGRRGGLQHIDLEGDGWPEEGEE
jgi:hypothetical protein